MRTKSLARMAAWCSLDWALQFAPDDAIVYLLGGNYSWKARDFAGARASYELALELAPDSAEAHCNLGLFLVEQGDFAPARAHARAAYASSRSSPMPAIRSPFSL